jgi:hypothetical protein
VAQPYSNLLPVGGTWTNTGPATFTVDSVTGRLTINTDGTSAAISTRAVATEVNKQYQLSWHNDSSVIMFRQLGTSQGGGDLVGYNASAAGDNKLNFIATTTTTWVTFLRLTAGAPSVSSINLEEVKSNTSKARRINARDQFFSLDAQANLLRMSNANWYIGGFVAFTYMPSATVYLADFGRLDLTSASGGAARVRLLWDPSQTKIAMASAETSGSSYRENYIISALQPNTWYYVGMVAKTNADVQVILETQRGASYVGTAIPPVSATEICRVLQLGARTASPRTNFAPCRYSNWLWCSNWIPTDTQINALAAGYLPGEIAGFSPPTGANLYQWPMGAATGDEASIIDTATFLSNGTYSSPVSLQGPILASSAVTAPTTPLDIIIV